MLISKLHYITTNPEQAEQACKGGANWVQLRIKNKPYEEWKSMALATQKVCKQYGAKLIINDNVMLAKEIKADGIHLGKEDMSPVEARALVGKNTIIGGTANTSADIQRLSEAKVDYIGLGPFRFTATKDNLSPILGLEGYQNIIRYCRITGISLPIIAIGGITLSDVAALLNTGIHGVAISSAITQAEDITAAAKQFMNQLQETNQ
ncbi:MAG: thiamine phosphate synthase [Bacteroidota bacterium]